MHKSKNNSVGFATQRESPVKEYALSNKRSLSSLGNLKKFPILSSFTENQNIMKKKHRKSIVELLNSDLTKSVQIKHRRIETLNKLMDKCKSISKLEKTSLERCQEATNGISRLRDALERYQSRIKKPAGHAETERLLKHDSVKMVNDLKYQNKIKLQKVFIRNGKSVKIYRNTDKLIYLISGKLSQKDGFAN